MENTKHKRPFGFSVCALGFTFERLSFYAVVKYLLAIWIATGAGLFRRSWTFRHTGCCNVRFFRSMDIHHTYLRRLHR